MARPPKKTSRKTKRTSSPGKRKTSTRKKTTSGRRTPSRRQSTPRQTPPSFVSGLSLDRKLDLVGVLLALLGLLTLLSLLSSERSKLFEAMVHFLKVSLGWGLYLLPAGLIITGLWLILRNFERIPQLAAERLAGIAILYVNILAFLHFLAFPADRAASFALAAEGRGGGYLGGVIVEGFVTSLGLWGTAIALMAWMLIGIMLTLDVSVADLFRWIPPLAAFLKTKLAALKNRRPAPPPQEFSPGEGVSIGKMKPHPRGEAAAPQVSLGIPGTPIREWTLPPIDQILERGKDVPYSDDFDRKRSQLIEETLASFGAPAHIVEINRGPTITQYGVEPDFIETRNGRTRVRVGKIAALADDLALALAASRIRIQAPVPGKGFVGIEVPNEEIAMVALRDVIESQAFQNLKSPLRFALGQDVAGNAVAADLAAMPHLLIAGATGSGKSVCVNAIISCFLINHTPNDLRVVMVDPKRVELTGYNGIPHLLAPVVVEVDRVIGALQWILREMDTRYHKFAEAGARNITEYNNLLLSQGQAKVPYLLVVIDELADLMMLAPDQTERAITRLAQLARATGIHLIISTQRPSVDVVTGLIKANFPARVAFAVSSSVDSRVILDQPGAERLLGRGDMLFQAPDAPAPVRLQGAFVSDLEILRIVQYWRGLNAAAVKSAASSGLGSNPPVDAPPVGIPLRQMPIWEEMEPEEKLDPLFNEAVDLVRRQGRASISMLQRRMRIGYTRAARLVETMEEKGIISSPKGGSRTREVLDYGPAAPPAGES